MKLLLHSSDCLDIRGDIRLLIWCRTSAGQIARIRRYLARYRGRHWKCVGAGSITGCLRPIPQAAATWYYLFVQPCDNLSRVK